MAESGKTLGDPSTLESQLPGRLPVGKAALFWILQSIGWLAFGIAMFIWGLEHWNLVDALANKILLIFTGFLLTLALRILYRTARKWSLPHIGSAALVLISSFAGAVAWYQAATILFAVYYTGAHGLPMQWGFATIPIGLLLYYGFVLLTWSLFYYGIHTWIEAENQRARALRAELSAHDARLLALRAQLEPHFLFNTLNAISTLIVEGKNASAVTMISRLSDFLRLTLENVEATEIPVAEELEFVKRYLEIEQTRFGDRLRVIIDAEPETMNALVPTLVLQPLVENAVKHGIFPREAGGSVGIAVARKNGMLELSVTDDGPGLRCGAHVRHGVGLANTAARLQELYADSMSFRLDDLPSGGLAARIAIPFHTSAPLLDEHALRLETERGAR
jgi:two-component system, LytTR family, sensor kinase